VDDRRITGRRFYHGEGVRGGCLGQAEVGALEYDRDMERVILHVDMDAFFASVEIRERPELAGAPVLVGGDGPRGVIAAASYEARRYGCRSAQPTAIARRHCPKAVILPPRLSLYKSISRQVFAVLDRFSPLVEGLSIDEAFLDMSGARRLFGDPRAAAQAIVEAVYKETQLSCSVGAANCKLVAKIASAFEKPRGITIVPPGDERAFLDPLPVGVLWGVGPKAQERLQDRGIATIGDLARAGATSLQSWFGHHGAHLHRLAQAIDPREVLAHRPAKSVSHEDTYTEDIEGESRIHCELLRQATRVADRLVAADLRARRIQLKIRDQDFRTETRQLTLGRASAEAKVIFEAVRKLLQSVEIEGRRFRLTGVGVGDFDTGAEQLDLLAGASNGRPARGEALQAVMSAVRGRYGHQALYPGDAGERERPGPESGFEITAEDRARRSDDD